jgi:hypothetical protein
LISVALVVLCVACGGMGNDTSMGACKYLVKALHEGDREAVVKINHSESYDFPTNHLMKFAPMFQDVDLNQIEYDQRNDRTVAVKFRYKDGHAQERTFYFLREKEGYFFISMS